MGRGFFCRCTDTFLEFVAASSAVLPLRSLMTATNKQPTVLLLSLNTSNRDKLPVRCSVGTTKLFWKQNTTSSPRSNKPGEQSLQQRPSKHTRTYNKALNFNTYPRQRSLAPIKILNNFQSFSMSTLGSYVCQQS